MRILCAAVLALLLPSCVLRPGGSSIEDLQGETAMAIGGNLASKDIKIQNTYVMLFSSHWVATTPAGAVYNCTQDQLTADVACEPKGR